MTEIMDKAWLKAKMDELDTIERDFVRQGYDDLSAHINATTKIPPPSLMLKCPDCCYSRARGMSWQDVQHEIERSGAWPNEEVSVRCDKCRYGEGEIEDDEDDE